jgi:outer membrane protein assembly factor BamB
LLATPAVTPDGPVVVDREGRVSAWTTDGQLRWQRELGEIGFYGAPLLADNALLLGTAGGSLWKLNAVDGQVIWRVRDLGPVYATPRLADGRVLVGDNLGRLHVIGVDSGELLARWTAAGAIQSTPVVLGDLLIIGARDHRVHALELLARPLPAAAEE